LWLEGERAHYLSRVLRVRSGDEIVVFDGSGAEYAAAIAGTTRQRVQLIPGEARVRDVESPLAIRLLQGISRGDRMDMVVQKATELGVRRISPVLAARSVVRLHEDRVQKKSEHWSRIAQSACEQCGRNRIPIVDTPAELPALLAAPIGATCIVLLPGGSEPLGDLQQVGSAVDLLIGPEGGLDAAEIAMAEAYGYRPHSLGPRILRTETAALAAIAILQSRFGDLRHGGS
jgi:16S rRNA (uracil1498-N3)-methyltransferase